MKDRAPESSERARSAAKQSEGSEGAPVPRAIAARWSSTLGDLSDVRVHVGPASIEATRALDARAATFGRSIHFGEGHYQPGTAAGVELLGHELVHAAQHRLGPASGPSATERAETEAKQVLERPRAPSVAGGGLVHRSPPGDGLKEGERLPEPLLIAVAGDRFLVHLEVDNARAVAFVLESRGDNPVQLQDGADATRTRLVAATAHRPIAASLIEIAEDGFVVDLYGDRLELLRLIDHAEAGPDGASRLHALSVMENGVPALVDGKLVEQKLVVVLPKPVQTQHGEAGLGTPERVVSQVVIESDDVFLISARSFGDANHVVVNIQSGLWAEPFGTHPNTYVAFAKPREQLSLAVLQQGAVIDLDLDGDHNADLRFVHTASDDAPRSVGGLPEFIERYHRFVAFDAAGQQLSVNVHVQRHETEAGPLKPIAKAEQSIGAGENDAGAQVGQTDIGIEPGRPGEASGFMVRHGGVVDLLVDGDGDRTQELLLRFRPEQQSFSDGLEHFTLQVIQLETRALFAIPFTLTADQKANLGPLVVRAGDGVNATEIDVVNRFSGTVPAPRFRIAIWPPNGAVDGQVTYPIDVDGTPYEVTLPAPTTPAAELVQAMGAPTQLGGVWSVDVVLGEYGDRFRLTFETLGDKALLGIAALAQVDGALKTTETRVVPLVAGTTTAAPAPLATAPVLLTLQLGDKELDIADALQAPAGGDVLVERTHLLTVTGDAVISERVVRFDYNTRWGGFGTPDTAGVEDFTKGLVPPFVPDDEAQYKLLLDRAHLLGPILRALSDQGLYSTAAYEAWRDAQHAVIALRRQTARRANPPPDYHPPSQATIEALEAIAAGALVAWERVGPSVATPTTLTEIAAKVRAGDWSLFADFVAFSGALDTWAREQASENTDQREAAAAAASVDILASQGGESGNLATLIQRFDIAVGQQVVAAHEHQLVSDVIYDAWNQLRLLWPRLKILAAQETAALASVADDGVIERAATAATALLDAFAALGPLNPLAGTTLPDDLRNHAWDRAPGSYAQMMSAIDLYVKAAIAKAAEDNPHDEALVGLAQQDRYVRAMQEQLAKYQNETDVQPVSATFVPDASYSGEAGFVKAVPLRLIAFRRDGDWELRDFTNPLKPWEGSVADHGEATPPAVLFKELDDKDEFPLGVIYYQVSGGEGGRVRTQAKKKWYEWARDIGLGLAVVGITLSTFGTGTVAVVGAWVLAGSAVVNAAGATGQLIDTVHHGTATTTSVLLNVFDIVASLASAGSLVAGTTVKTAQAAARAGTAWTGTAARIAAFADKAYVPLLATGVGAQAGTLAVMPIDIKHQLDGLRAQGATEQEIRAAQSALLMQLAITGGMTALAIKGDLPEIKNGRQIVLDVVGDMAIARAAGVRLAGVDLEIAAGDLRAHAAARWQVRDVEAGRVDLGGDADLAEWHKAWLEQPERLTFKPDGSAEIVMPMRDGKLPPPDIQAKLRGLVDPQSALYQAERMFAVAKEVEAIESAGKGLRVDPTDANWKTTRAELVQRLGGNEAAEAIVAKFEAARLAGLDSTAQAFVAQRRLVNRVIPDNEIERIRNLFPGFEVYVTGAPAEAGEVAAVDRVQIVVAVPAGMSADQMAAIEQRAQMLRLHPDPAYLGEHGLPPDHTLPMEAKVVPEAALVGVSASGAALHRIDAVLDTKAAQLAGVLDTHLAHIGIDASVVHYRVVPMPPAEFRAKFGSEVHGRSVFRLESDGPVIYASLDASPADMLDEAAHIAQAQNPELAAQMRQLDEMNMHDWAAAPAQYRLEQVQTKLDLEIDAKQQTLAALEQQGPSAEVDIATTQKQLDQLKAQQAEIASITPDQLARMNAGEIPMPSYLDEPPWLFGKRPKIVEGTKLDRFAIDPKTPRTVVPEVGPERSTAYDPEAGVKSVRQIGSTWKERGLIRNGFEGKVTSIKTARDGSKIITVTRESGLTQSYAVEAGGTLNVNRGDTVNAGDTLAEEANREYRFVEVDYGNGRTDTRSEIRSKDPKIGWQQRGAESTFRGGIMETAADKQIEADLAARLSSKELSGKARLVVDRGGGGFDHVVVEFTGTGKATTAEIRVIEVKDYPGRSVPLEEFTAIGKPGLKENLTKMRNDISAAVTARERGLPEATPFASMSDDQLRALETAAYGQGIHIEVMTGATTRLGGEDHFASTVLPQLRKDIKGIMKYDALVLPEGGIPAKVEPKYVDQALAQALAEEAQKAIP